MIRRAERARALRPALALLLALATPAPAAPPTSTTGTAEYDPTSTAWNGMATFVGVAEGMGFTVSVKTALEWDELGAEHILVLVFPLQRLDPARLGAFVNAGGNVVIADDFGEARDAMAAMGLLRAEVEQAVASRFYEGHTFAPIANALGSHPIARDVGDVITNHPAVLTQVAGADVVVGFDADAVVVAGERGSGRFVAISDPSILINRMLQFPGNYQLVSNILDWLDRKDASGKRRATEIVLLRGDAPMYGEPRPFVDDPRAGELGRSIADLNWWFHQASTWLLTPTAMKLLAGALAAILLGLALIALPVRRGPRIDGAWLRFVRPTRRDEPHGLVAAADRGGAGNLVIACILRDHVQRLIGELTARLEPLYTLPETQLVAELTRAKGAAAGAALARVYRRLRALPSRGQAAAPWSAGHLPRRDFDTLYRDVAELCRTLGAALPDAEPLTKP